MPIRIIIADDHNVVRRGLKAILHEKPGWTVCAEAADGREAVECAKRLKPDVVILDVAMPLLNGVEAARQIRKVSPKTEVLILSAHSSERLASEVLHAGARGYLVKDDADEELIAAVDALRRHKPYFSSRLGEAVTRHENRLAGRKSRRVLTPREREVMQLVAEGKTNKEVADMLGMSVKTAETHRANIMLKLDLHSVTELVHYAIRNEMIRT